MKTSIVNLVIAIMLLFAAGAKASLVTIFDAGEKERYMQLAGSSEWALIGSADFDKAKAPYSGVFTITNLLDQYRGEDQKVGNQQGNYTLDKFNGNGAGYAKALTGTDDYVGMAFSHNSADVASISIPEGLINSFYLNVSTHANINSTEGTFNITLTTTEGIQEFKDIDFGWVGFILDDGVYLTGFEITQNSNPNTGFTFDFVLGDGTATTPEPATLLIFGLGMTGLGLVQARRNKKNKVQ